MPRISAIILDLEGSSESIGLCSEALRSKLDSFSHCNSKFRNKQEVSQQIQLFNISKTDGGTCFETARGDPHGKSALMAFTAAAAAAAKVSIAATILSTAASVCNRKKDFKYCTNQDSQIGHKFSLIMGRSKKRDPGA